MPGLQLGPTVRRRERRQAHLAPVDLVRVQKRALQARARLHPRIVLNSELLKREKTMYLLGASPMVEYTIHRAALRERFVLM
jgi:hypothetical protein